MFWSTWWKCVSRWCKFMGKKRRKGNVNPPGAGRSSRTRVSHHLFPEQSQSRVQVGRFGGESSVHRSRSSPQVVLDHGLLGVHPLDLPPRAAARVQQTAQALRQRRKTLNTGRSSARRTVRRLAVHVSLATTNSLKINNNNNNSDDNNKVSYTLTCAKTWT